MRLTRHPFRGQFAYLATMGFGVTYVRLVAPPLRWPRQSALDRFSRGRLLLSHSDRLRSSCVDGRPVGLCSCLKWTGRKSFWIVSSLFLVLVLTVPVVGEQVLPGGSADTREATLARVTTGRSELWEELLETRGRGAALGAWLGLHLVSDFDEIFRVRGAVRCGGKRLLSSRTMTSCSSSWNLGSWVSDCCLPFGSISSGRSDFCHEATMRQARYDVRVLVPVIIVMLLVQLFDNGFAIRFVAERFFIAAGLVFGLQYLAERALRTSSAQDLSVPVK